MSNFCQFCDKEMMLEESVVYEQGYITCGVFPCIEKARGVAEEIRIENSTVDIKVMVFSTNTPEDDASWRGVAEADYPDWLVDEDIVSSMLEGTGMSEDGKTYYIAMKAEDYIKSLQYDGEIDNED